MTTNNMYFVWRRNDGYVDSTNGRMPTGWTSSNGDVTTFEKLGQFDNWSDAYDCIVENRAKGESQSNQVESNR